MSHGITENYIAWCHWGDCDRLKFICHYNLCLLCPLSPNWKVTNTFLASFRILNVIWVLLLRCYHLHDKYRQDGRRSPLPYNMYKRAWLQRAAQNCDPAVLGSQHRIIAHRLMHLKNWLSAGESLLRSCGIFGDGGMASEMDDGGRSLRSYSLAKLLACHCFQPEFFCFL